MWSKVDILMARAWELQGKSTTSEAARVLGGGFHDCMQATELFRLVLALGLWPQRLSEDGDTVPAARVSSSPTIDMALP